MGLAEDINKTSPKYDAALRVSARPRAALFVGARLGEEIGSEREISPRPMAGSKKGGDKVGIEPNKWLQYAARVSKAGSNKFSANIESGDNAKTRNTDY